MPLTLLNSVHSGVGRGSHLHCCSNALPTALILAAAQENPTHGGAERGWDEGQVSEDVATVSLAVCMAHAGA